MRCERVNRLQASLKSRTSVAFAQVYQYKSNEAKTKLSKALFLTCPHHICTLLDLATYLDDIELNFP